MNKTFALLFPVVLCLIILLLCARCSVQEPTVPTPPPKSVHENDIQPFTGNPADEEIPCIGMKEADINKTKFGDKLFVTTKSSFAYKGKMQHYIHYSDAQYNKRQFVTLHVGCKNGVVFEVDDYRANPEIIP